MARGDSIMDVDLPVMPPVAPMLARAVKGLRRRRACAAGCRSSRSGTASAASSSATATRSSWPAATSSPSPGTSPRWSPPSSRETPQRCVLDGEIVLARGGRLDFEALQQRIHPADSRVRRLADRDARRPRGLRRPRARRRRPAARAARRQAASGCSASGSRAPACSRLRRPRTPPWPRSWFEHVRGRRARRHRREAARRGPTRRDARTMLKVKHERTADCVLAGYRLHKTSTPAGPAARLAPARALRRRGHAAARSGWRPRSRWPGAPPSSRSWLPWSGVEDHPWAA